MTWAMAYARAVDMARVSGRRWYVRGYRNILGDWRYGAYNVPRPKNDGREW